MIVDDLAVWGPECVTGQPPPIADARAYCRRLALGHYENFPVVSWLLPGPLQQHFCNVYAFCRWADDLGDETGDPERALQLLSWWRSETEDCYRGITRHPVFVALRETIEQFELPAEPFLDLISAFEQDQHVTEYETFDQLRDYCRRSAIRSAGSSCVWAAATTSRPSPGPIRSAPAFSWRISGRMSAGTWRLVESTCRPRTGTGSAIPAMRSIAARPARSFSI